MTSEFEKLKNAQKPEITPLRRLDLILQKEIGDYFHETKGEESIQDLLSLWIETTARIVYTCVKEDSRKNPAQTAKDFGHLVELAIIGMTLKVESIKEKMGIK